MATVYPELPEYLQDHGLVDQELGELWRDLIEELMNPERISQTHHNRRTHGSGCRGPLCRKAAREYSRRRIGAGTSEKFIYLDPILDFWHPIAVMRIDAARTVMMHQLTA